VVIQDLYFYCKHSSQYWTVNNFSVTAGSDNDSLVDTPTSYGTDTGVGGEVRGNYCTLNPLFLPDTHTFTQGNLTATTSTGAHQAICATFAISSGKWYWEYVWDSGPSGNLTGIWRSNIYTIDTYVGSQTGSYSYYSADGNKYAAGSASSYGASFTTGDVIGVAFDADTGSLTFYKNGASQGVAYSSIPVGNGQSYYPAWSKDTSGTNTTTSTLNFGQRAFAYPLSGFQALCDTNLGAPLVAKPNELMDVKLYTGNGSTQTISGLGFSPDLVWLKARSFAPSHHLFDTIRGATKFLGSDTTNAEQTGADRLTAFDSTGFTLGSNAEVNQSSSTYVGWAWDAGTSTVSNTSGSITSQVRANVSAGFSVVSWTNGSNTNPTVNTLGHGLGVVPSLVIVKSRTSGASDWLVKSEVFSDPVRDELYLNTTAAKATAGVDLYYRTSSVLGFRETSIGGNGDNMIAYCWAPLVGYSSFGSYVGNGSSDGVFVFCNFRPRYLMIKRSSGIGDWVIYDSVRLTYNANNVELYANSSGAEVVDDPIDILSNGFKIRTTGSGVNSSGNTYVFAAFAESPFQYARAR
jgi:hypothetical protein